jgi:hypothetical protein
MAEGYVQVAADGSGKKVRNLQLDVLQSDGSTATVYMQVIAIADREGNPISLEPDRLLLRDIRREGRIQTEVLLRLLAACEPGKDVDREDIVDELDKQTDLEGEEQGDER